MDVRRLGTLAATDPLYDVLAGVLSHLGAELRGGGPAPGVLDVEQLSPMVYRYRDAGTDTAVVVKFFGDRARPPERQSQALHAEFGNLQRLRALGFDRRPHRVVRPLTLAPAVNAALVLESVPGPDLLTVIRDGSEEQLLTCVDAVSGFLAALHDRTRTGGRADPGPPLGYLHKVVTQLVRTGLLDPGESDALLGLGEAWRASGVLAAAPEVLIHGDATPRHFLLDVRTAWPEGPADGEPGVTVIDLERLGPGDPVADVGRLAAELKHLLLEQTGDPQASEPAIRGLYAAYARRAGIPPPQFAGLTERGRFYMGRDLLRIARNTWIDRGQRRRLVPEALACLRR